MSGLEDLCLDLCDFANQLICKPFQLHLKGATHPMGNVRELSCQQPAPFLIQIMIKKTLKIRKKCGPRINEDSYQDSC